MRLGDADVFLLPLECLVMPDSCGKLSSGSSGIQVSRLIIMITLNERGLGIIVSVLSI